MNRKFRMVKMKLYPLRTHTQWSAAQAAWANETGSNEYRISLRYPPLPLSLCRSPPNIDRCISNELYFFLLMYSTIHWGLSPNGAMLPLLTLIRPPADTSHNFSLISGRAPFVSIIICWHLRACNCHNLRCTIFAAVCVCAGSLLAHAIFGLFINNEGIVARQIIYWWQPRPQLMMRCSKTIIRIGYSI